MRTRRVAAGMVALGLAMTSVGGAVAEPTEELIAGDTVEATVIEMSQAVFADDSTSEVVLARGNPDGYAASVLAARLGGPVLTSDQDEVSDAVLTELERLGSVRVTVLGGAVAFDERIDQQLADEGYEVRRIAGETRYRTAVLISEASVDADTDVVVVDGSFVDGAFLAAAEAVHQNASLLLVTEEDIPEDTQQELQRLTPATITLIAGPFGDSDALAARLEGFADQVVTVQGETRHELGRRLAERQGLVGETLSLAPSEAPPGEEFEENLFAVAMAAPAAFDGPLMYGDDDADSQAVVAEDEIDAVRFLHTASVTAGDVVTGRVAAGGTFRTADDAEPGRPAVAITSSEPGDVSVTFTDQTGEVSPGDDPFLTRIRISAPDGGFEAPTTVTFAIDVADLPAGAGVDDIDLYFVDGAVPTGGACDLRDLEEDDGQCRRAVLSGDDVLVSYSTRYVSGVWSFGIDPVSRRDGEDRYVTGALSVTQTPLLASDRVFVATGENYPDALAAAAVAGATGSRVVSTAGSQLSTPSRIVVGALRPDRVTVVGGPAAVSQTVVDALGVASDRVAGESRYDTAAQLALGDGRAPGGEVVIATGTNFPDALTGAVAAALRDAPVLLTDPAALPQVTRDALGSLQPTRITVLGGTNAVSTAVEQELASFAPTTRISGVDRYATSAAVARAQFITADVVFLATGRSFADALAGAPIAAAADGPLVLTEPDRLPAETRQIIEELRPDRVVLLGGTTALTPAVEAEVRELLATIRG